MRRFFRNNHQAQFRVFTLDILAATTAPTKGTAVEKAVYRIIGDSIEVYYSFNQSVAGAAGTGAYIFAFPNGFEIDEDKARAPSATNQETTAGAAQGQVGGTDYWGVARHQKASDSRSGFGIILGNEAAGPTAVGSGFLALSNTDVDFSFYATVPLLGFQGKS